MPPKPAPPGSTPALPGSTQALPATIEPIGYAVGRPRPSIADDIEAIARIDSIPSILDVVCRVSGMRFAAVARVTDDSWTACAVRDEIDFGLAPGGQLDLVTTICNEIRSSHTAVIIDHVAEDTSYRDHPTPRLYGFQSYLSMPIIRTNGAFFGTLCALDPLPAKLRNPAVITTFRLFAELIALHLEAVDSARQSQAALLDAQQTAELREQFIAVLGHDLRNPVAAIDAGTRLLQSAGLDDRAARIVTMMQESCRRMTSLIGDVLDFARGRLGGGLPVDRLVHETLGLALDQVIAEIRAAHPGRTITASIELAEPVACEPARIAQLLSNLLANAVVHGDVARPVRVQATSINGVFRLEVANHGAPIAPTKLDKLFQPFTRADDGKPHQGLGLGLYIAAEIARAHGGDIEVTSTATETRFTLVMANRLA